MLQPSGNSRWSYRYGRPISGTWMLLLVAVVGCGGTSVDTPPPAPTTPLRVMVIGDETLAKKLTQFWQSVGEGELAIRSVPMDHIKQNFRRVGADVMIYPPAQLGTYIEQGVLAEIPRERWNATELNPADLLKLARSSSSRWGSRVYGLPLSSPQLMLMYRADLFSKWDLQVPKTWGEYQALVAELSARDLESESVERATLEPLADHWRSTTFLARAAPYARHPLSSATLFRPLTFDPQVTQPPFVKALDELVAANPDPVWLTPEEVYSQFAAGKAVMAIGWPTRQDIELANDEMQVKFAPLPGSEQVYDTVEKEWDTREDDGVVPLVGFAGHIGSVTRESARQSEGLELLTLLSQPDSAAKVIAPSELAGPIRESQLSVLDIWLDEQTLESGGNEFKTAMLAIHDCEDFLQFPRFTQQAAYLAVLEAAVKKALDGEEASTVLEECAKEWEQLSTQLDRSVVRQSHASSL